MAALDVMRRHPVGEERAAALAQLVRAGTSTPAANAEAGRSDGRERMAAAVAHARQHRWYVTPIELWWARLHDPRRV